MRARLTISVKVRMRWRARARMTVRRTFLGEDEDEGKHEMRVIRVMMRATGGGMDVYGRCAHVVCRIRTISTGPTSCRVLGPALSDIKSFP